MSDDDDQKFEDAVMGLPNGKTILGVIQQDIKLIAESIRNKTGESIQLCLLLISHLKEVIYIQNNFLSKTIEQKYTVIDKFKSDLRKAKTKLEQLKERHNAFKGGKSTSPSDIIYKGKKAIRKRFFMTKEEKEAQPSLERQRADLRRAKEQEIEAARDEAFPNGYYSTSPVIKRFMRKINQKKEFSAGKLNREAFRQKLRENDWSAVKHRFELTPSGLP